MLEQCFLHLPGIGAGFAAKLAAAGIITWADALTMPLPCGGAKAAGFLAGVRESQVRLEAGDYNWFSAALAPAEHWRFYPHCRDKAAYVDIETTGLSGATDCITTIALYGGGEVRTYVSGRNLEAFADDIAAFDLLVTWNGRGFDAPILRRALCIPLAMPHLDLLPVFRKLDLRGGLKRVEKALGITRNELDGVDGWMAVLLWREFERTGDERVLETLLAYNVEDVLSLEYLAAYALMRHTGLDMERFGCSAVHHERNPFVADRAVLRRLASW